MDDATCKVNDCVKSVRHGALGMCPMHYARFHKHGSTDDPKVDNFARYEPDHETGCWQWCGPTDGKGYGFFSRKYEGEHRAHRAFWVRERGPIPVGLEIDHLCRNRGCVNPDHMELVTHWENMQRAELGQWGVERCRSGKHDVTGPNSWVIFSRRPEDRYCRECYTEAYERRKAKMRGGRPPRDTHCRNGHEYTTETTKRLKDGTRRCLTCLAIRKGSST